MRSFNARSTEPELMDTIEVPFEEFHACLKELSTINRLTPVSPALAPHAATDA